MLTPLNLKGCEISQVYVIRVFTKNIYRYRRTNKGEQFCTHY